MISVSNTGKCISIYMDDASMTQLDQLLHPSDYGRFGINYETGFIEFGPVGTGKSNRIFRRPVGAPTKWTLTLMSSDFPEMPTFGRETYDSFYFEDGLAKIPLPRNPKPVQPRTYRRLPEAADNAPKELILDQPVPEGAPKYDPATGRWGAKNGFHGWTSLEAWQKSRAGMLAGQAKSLAIRRAKAQAKRLRKQQKQAKLIRQAQNVTSAPTQPAAQTPELRQIGTANVMVEVAGKLVTFNVPESEVVDFAFDLSEKGYRVKETA